MKLQAIEGDRIADPPKAKGPASEQPNVVSGVEVTDDLKPVKFHIWKRPKVYRSQRKDYVGAVKAQDFIHYFDPERFDQCRGISRFIVNHCSRDARSISPLVDENCAWTLPIAKNVKQAAVNARIDLVIEWFCRITVPVKVRLHKGLECIQRERFARVDRKNHSTHVTRVTGQEAQYPVRSVIARRGIPLTAVKRGHWRVNA